MHFLPKPIILVRVFSVFEKAGRAQPLNRRSLFAIQWIERIGFSLPAFTGFNTQLSGARPTAADLEATRHAADPFGAIPRPFWGPSGDYLGPWPQDGAKMAPKGPKMAKRWPQGGPKRPHNGPRWPRDGPKMGPTGPKMAPRWPQDGPKMAPRSPKMP